MESKNIPTKNYQWELSLGKYGTVEYAVFGLGIQKIVAWISKLHHISIYFIDTIF